MAPNSPSSRLVTAAAREVLRPLGLQQRGRSRTWLDDQGWWLGVVEFQPSSWGQGTYLSVGAMWLWDDADYLAFHVGGREAGHESYKDEAQFASLAMDMARLAASRTVEYRGLFTSPTSTAKYLAAHSAQRGNAWDNYHAGVAAGLVGDADTARDRLARATQQFSGTDIPWRVQAHQTSLQLRDMADDAEALRSWAAERITSCRQKLKLGPSPAGLPEELQLP
ncbi:hypothetical protein [Kitasatospora sp. MAP5-34]|uniref:hypothetical protein n=1 Tax=Kitasatospora sp. MAP5-34 TaxID=3035102 RepID=UPI00247401B4|nr:hypothetical protein [Kitasatospora sp. MAP5-34]MDH6580640.1 hypothetical protein [Kitasatospora sp. MAP5-34]